MNGVYGDFLSAFSELIQRAYFYCGSEGFHASFVLLPAKGTGLQRHDGAVDLQSTATMYSSSVIAIGWYFREPRTQLVYRVVRLKAYDTAGGFYVYTVALVQGDNGSMNKPLAVKEPYFA